MIGFDLSISVGSIIQTVLIIGGGIYALGALRANVTTIKEEVAASKLETKDSIDHVEDEIKKIGEILVKQADQNRRIIHLEEDVRELRHGRGFVRGEAAGSIDREWGKE